MSSLQSQIDLSIEESVSPGAPWHTDLELPEGREYTLELTYRGERPVLFAEEGPNGEPKAKISRLPAEVEPGVLRAVLLPTQGMAHLQVRLQRGEVQLERLRVRRWATARKDGVQDVPGWQTVNIFGDHRVATILRPGQESVWEVDVPQGARSLHFDVVSDPRLDPSLPPVEGTQLLVRVLPLAGAPGLAVSEVSKQVDWSRASWQPLEISLASELSLGSGQRVRLAVRCVGPEGGLAREGVGMSLPFWHCTLGARRPNLVLISLDTTRPDHLGIYGAQRDTSPELDAFAQQSFVFEAAQSTAPYTLPAHASMLSGLYPSTHGAEHPAHALDPGATPLLADILGREGYATRAFTGGGYLDADFGFAHGFQGYSNSDPVAPIAGWEVKAVQASEEGSRYVEARRAQHWSAALEWIELHQSVPFFLFLQTFAIHDYRPTLKHRLLFGAPRPGEGVVPLRKPPDQHERPYNAEERDQLLRLYDGAIHEVDALMGELFATLESSGLAEHTVVIITSDHGEDFGEHDVDGKPFIGHAQALWQSLLHVPLIVRVPGALTQAGPRRIPIRVSMVDLAPTALDFLGVPIPQRMQGRSLRSLMLTGEGARSPVLSELHSNRGFMRSLLSDDLKVIHGDPAALVSWPVDTAIQLYDLGADPEEQTDLATEREALSQGLADTLQRFGAELEGQRVSDDKAAGLSEETRRRLEELGYVDG